MKWIISLQAQAFKELLLEYIEYLEVDLANSLINKTKFSRNVHLLYSFKDLFSYTLNPIYVEDGAFKARLEELKESIKNYRNTAKDTIQLNVKIHIDTNLIRQFILSDMFKAQYKEFYLSNIAFSESFKNSLVNREEFKDYLPTVINEEYAFAQSLLEFNNALSHLIMAVCQKHKLTQRQNIKNAMNHFYRATLDNYKIIIRFSMPKVQNNEHILESFLSIRESEFLLLGEDIKSKKIKFYNPNERITKNENILVAYKTLFESIKQLIL